MPKIAVDEQGQKQQHKILGGRAEVVLFDHRPAWHYRQYLSKQRKYITRALEVENLEDALRVAEDLYLEFAKQSDPDGVPSSTKKKIKDLIKDWIKENEQKQRTGQITTSTLRGKTTALEGAVRIYLLEHLELQTIGDIKQDTFLGYRTWRLTEGWKHINSSWGRWFLKTAPSNEN